VNFTPVARSADVSRQWLYRQGQIRNLITRLSHQEPPATALTAQRASTDSLSQRLDAARLFYTLMVNVTSLVMRVIHGAWII
jgi:hypothetical protein